MLASADEKEFDAKIRLLLDPNVQACIHEISRKQLAELRSEEHAIAEAYRGNMEWLLKRHPQYKNKRPLRPPKLKHGEHREKPPNYNCSSSLHAMTRLASRRFGKQNTTASVTDRKVR